MRSIISSNVSAILQSDQVVYIRLFVDGLDEIAVFVMSHLLLL